MALPQDPSTGVRTPSLAPFVRKMCSMSAGKPSRSSLRDGKQPKAHVFNAHFLPCNVTRDQPFVPCNVTRVQSRKATSCTKRLRRRKKASDVCFRKAASVFSFKFVKTGISGRGPPPARARSCSPCVSSGNAATWKSDLASTSNVQEFCPGAQTPCRTRKRAKLFPPGNKETCPFPPQNHHA